MHMSVLTRTLRGVLELSSQYLSDDAGPIVASYGSGGLRRSRSVRKYTDRLMKARIAAAMAPTHQYQPPSVTAATTKPAASTTSVMASPSRHHRENPELTL